MPVHWFDETDYLSEADNNKVQGLVLLHKSDIKTPDYIYIDEDEYAKYRSDNAISLRAKEEISKFIDSTKQKERAPLFSLRCESKYYCSEGRTPLSLLNIGLLSLEDHWLERLDIDADKHELIESTYQKRASHLSDIEISGLKDRFTTAYDEVLYWIYRIYDKLAELNINVSHGIIVQQMVLGCKNEKSCNGICCTLLNGQRFQGIVLLGQQGLGVDKGSWGRNEYSLHYLRQINPSAYGKLREIYDKLEHTYGPDRYLEFTVEGQDVYILDHMMRRRDVLPSTNEL